MPDDRTAADPGIDLGGEDIVSRPSSSPQLTEFSISSGSSANAADHFRSDLSTAMYLSNRRSSRDAPAVRRQPARRPMDGPRTAQMTSIVITAASLRI